MLMREFYRMNSKPGEHPVEERAKGKMKKKDLNENPKWPQLMSFLCRPYFHKLFNHLMCFMLRTLFSKG